MHGSRATLSDMKTTHSLACVLLLGAAGCVSEVSSTPPEAAPQACGQTLCLDGDAESDLSDAQADLARCVPNGDAVEGDPAGLRISEVDLVSVDGDRVSLRVVMANTFPDGVMTYPGSTLRVVAGEGSVVGDMSGQRYGIFGCEETEATFTVTWSGEAPLTLAAAATNDLGTTVIHEVELTLQPAE
jgi:hypothetical protein